MENSSVASASSEAGSTRSQEIEELERFIDSYVLEYQVQGLLGEKGDDELDNSGNVTQVWTDDFNNQKDGSWTSSHGRGSFKPDEWEHSSNGSTGSRPSSGSRPGSGSRSGSKSRNNQFRGPAKNGNMEGFDILGTDIWAANTMDSLGGTGWDVQPEKLDFSHFNRKPLRVSPKHLPHIDRDGIKKDQCDVDDGIDMNEIERFLPHLRSVFPPLPSEAEISNTKKLFRRKRNDRRRQQRPQGGGGGGGGGHHIQQAPQHQRDLTPHQQPSPNHSPSELGDGRINNGARPPRHGPRQGAHPQHGYSQNRRWQHNQKGPQEYTQTHTVEEREFTPRTTKDVKNDRPSAEPEDCSKKSPAETQPRPHPVSANHERRDPPQKEAPTPTSGEEQEHKVSLLQSSREGLRKRLKDKEEVCVESGPGGRSMDRLVELLNSMRSNSSGVEQQLASFMQEAQSSARCEESLVQVVSAIYSTALSDRSFAATAAKLCDRMALFMVDGTKFRSLLLNLLQMDFFARERLRQTDVEKWLGFITFLCELFGAMRSSSGQPYRVLVCPIFTCLRELLDSREVKEDAVLCCSMELQNTGLLLEEQLPEMMTELLAAVRDKMLCPSASPLTRSLLMEVIELHAHRWVPLESLTTHLWGRVADAVWAVCTQGQDRVKGLLPLCLDSPPPSRPPQTPAGRPLCGLQDQTAASVQQQMVD
uniref:MIF4G domain-containing protein n=1 Tax=Knipowitschia caucasica TaxID=637954 RepID=A0AAV2IUW7_KNICA